MIGDKFSDRHNLRAGMEDACLDGAALCWGGPPPQQASSNMSGVRRGRLQGRAVKLAPQLTAEDRPT
jgi:hypothetical protein